MNEMNETTMQRAADEEGELEEEEVALVVVMVVIEVEGVMVDAKRIGLREANFKKCFCGTSPASGTKLASSISPTARSK